MPLMKKTSTVLFIHSWMFIFQNHFHKLKNVHTYITHLTSTLKIPSSHSPPLKNIAEFAFSGPLLFRFFCVPDVFHIQCTRTKEFLLNTEYFNTLLLGGFLGLLISALHQQKLRSRSGLFWRATIYSEVDGTVL